MKKELSQDEIWKLVGFVKVSQNKYKTLKALEDTFLMPTEIADITGLRTTQVSNTLHDLKIKDLVVCLNETAKKGRIYKNTELGGKILKMLDEQSI